MNRKKALAIVFIVLGLIAIPATHLIMDRVLDPTLSYVSTNEGSRIAAGKNIYAQLLPFILAYLGSPIVLLIGGLKLRKEIKNENKAS